MGKKVFEYTVTGFLDDEGGMWAVVVGVLSAGLLVGQVVTPRMYGAKGDGQADDTRAVQAALDAAKAGSKSVECGGGVFRVSGLKLADVRGFHFQGHTGGCTFEWIGDRTTPLWKLEDVAESTFEGFSVLVSKAAPMAAVADISNGAGVDVAPTRVRFRDVVAEGTNGGLYDGFRYSIGDGGDNNVDFMMLDNVTVNNYTHSCVVINGSQMHYMTFDMLGCAANGNGKYAISGDGDAGSRGGFTWRGGGVNGVTGAVWNMGDQAVPTRMEQLSIENSARLIVSGNTSANMIVSLDRVRFAANALAPDGVAIYIGNAGPFEMTNSQIESAPNGTVKIYLRPQQDSVFLFRNVFINSGAVRKSDLFTGVIPEMQGVQVRVLGAATKLLDRMPE